MQRALRPRRAPCSTASQRIADAARDVDVSDRDVVHYDFSPYNMLADGDRITGVVDWDGATSGDAAFDLVTLAFYTYDFAVRDELLGDDARGTTDPRGTRPVRRAHGAAPGRLVAAPPRRSRRRVVHGIGTALSTRSALGSLDS